MFQDEINRICIQNWTESSVYDVALDEALFDNYPDCQFWVRIYPEKEIPVWEVQKSQTSHWGVRENPGPCPFRRIDGKDHKCFESLSLCCEANTLSRRRFSKVKGFTKPTSLRGYTLGLKFYLHSPRSFIKILKIL